jgi:hypothetical protein
MYYSDIIAEAIRNILGEQVINGLSIIASALILYYLLNTTGILGSIVHTAKILRGRK